MSGPHAWKLEMCLLSRPGARLKSRPLVDRLEDEVRRRLAVWFR